MSSGLISGNPTTPGDYTVVATVTDALGATSEVTFGWHVDAAVGALTVNNPGPQSGSVGDTAALKITASGGVAPYTWTVAGQPPTTHIGSAGKITGTLTTVGTYSTTPTVHDSTAATASTTFSWVVDNGTTYTPPAGSILPDITDADDFKQHVGVNTHWNFSPGSGGGYQT